MEEGRRKTETEGDGAGREAPKQGKQGGSILVRASKQMHNTRAKRRKKQNMYLLERVSQPCSWDQLPGSHGPSGSHTARN